MDPACFVVGPDGPFHASPADAYYACLRRDVRPPRSLDGTNEASHESLLLFPTMSVAYSDDNFSKLSKRTSLFCVCVFVVVNR